MGHRLAIAALVAVALFAFGENAALAHGPRGGFHFGGSRPISPGIRFVPRMPATTVVRPAQPLRRFDSFGHHHYHRGSTFFFVTPYASGYSAFYGYPYSAFHPYPSFYDLSPATTYGSNASISMPYFCWLDGIGFTDEQRFAGHLHEAHGVPAESALQASEVIGGRYVFFGY